MKKAKSSKRKIMEEKKIGLRELREENGKTIADVAKALGVSVQAISNYEHGIRMISLEQTLILAELFEESVEAVVKAQLNSHYARGENRLKLRKNLQS